MIAIIKRMHLFGLPFRLSRTPLLYKTYAQLFPSTKVQFVFLHWDVITNLQKVQSARIFLLQAQNKVPERNLDQKRALRL